MIAWLLNLDADDELAAPERATAKDVADRVRGFAPRTGLVEPGDVLLGEGARAEGLDALAWMPTPRALATIERAGARPPRAPPLSVLQTVNHRAFATALGPTLPGAVFARSIAEVEGAIASAPAERWLLKRPYSFAGRGRRRVDGAPLPPDARGFVEASLRRFGGLAVEPLVARTDDFALHGHLDAEGTIVLGEPTRQRCDEHGAWEGTERASPSDLSSDERSSLVDAIMRAGRALASAGYFGPFGVDAFRWNEPSGAARFHPLCEINARYTMGWATGMGESRPDRPDRR